MKVRMVRKVLEVLGSLGILVVLATPAIGADASGSVDQPTFARDVAPIFQQKCQACHRPDSIAPMSLVTYEDARPWARSIRTRVAARQMPPWHIDKTVGIQHFENDASLSDRQIDTILRWVDAGAPAGEMKEMPSPVKWPSGDTWEFAEKFGQPDVIVKSPAWHMAAQAQDAWCKPVVDTGLKEQRWVRAIEIRPSTKKGRRITHHALARLKQDDGGDIRRRRAATSPHRDRRLVHGMGGRQAGRIDAAKHRQADAARLENHLGHPLPRRRGGHHRLRGTRHLLLSERSGAEVPHCPRQLRIDRGRQSKRSTSRRIPSR